MKYAWLVILCLTLASCANTGYEIPPQFKAEIVVLRDANVELTKKCTDLQKQLAETQAQMNWNAQRINIVGGEILQSLGVMQSDYTVNVITLKVEKVKH